MADVTIRDLRNHGADVIRRVLRGERLTVTRAGEPVAELTPVPREGLDARTLLARWRHLPPVDPRRVRADMDELIDPSL
jgi:prevent-host-death family protein